MRVWLTSQPSCSSSSKQTSMQAISRGHGSVPSRTGGSVRSDCPSAGPRRAYRWRAYSCHSSSSRYFARSAGGASAAAAHRCGSVSRPCRTYGDMREAPRDDAGSTCDRRRA